MGMRLHEVHASTVHTPLGLLPAAVGFDLAATLTGSRELTRMGGMLWWAGTAGGVFAALAGLAASQEVRTYEERTHQAMLVHGLGNTAITLAALGMSIWRGRNRPTIASTLIGLGAVSAAMWTAYLGGEIVYSRGVGIKPAGGISDSPEVLSTEAPLRFLKDAAKGLGWAMRHAGHALSSKPAQVMQVSQP